MIYLKFKVNKYIVLINSIIFKLNKIVLRNKELLETEDLYEKFIIKYTKIIIKELNLICWWDKLEEIKYEFYKIKYIIEKNIDIISIKELENLFEKSLDNGKRIFEILNFMCKQPEMQIILKETKEYKKQIEKVWNKNLITLNNYTEKTLNYCDKINGVVYIVSNRYYAGQADLETKYVRIIYGSKFTNKNYIKDIIYIYHEILHNPILLYYKFNISKNKVHNIIKLIADNHLNVLLNNGSYFEDDDSIINLLKIYPYWLKFLYRNDNNKQEKIKLSIDRDLKYLSLNNYNIKNLKNYFNFIICKSTPIENNIIDFVKNLPI